MVFATPSWFRQSALQIRAKRCESRTHAVFRRSKFVVSFGSLFSCTAPPMCPILETSTKCGNDVFPWSVRKRTPRSACTGNCTSSFVFVDQLVSPIRITHGDQFSFQDAPVRASARGISLADMRGSSGESSVNVCDSTIGITSVKINLGYRRQRNPRSDGSWAVALSHSVLAFEQPLSLVK